MPWLRQAALLGRGPLRLCGPGLPLPPPPLLLTDVQQLWPVPRLLASPPPLLMLLLLPLLPSLLLVLKPSLLLLPPWALAGPTDKRPRLSSST